MQRIAVAQVPWKSKQQEPGLCETVEPHITCLGCYCGLVLMLLHCPFNNDN
ncbi:hypothetical protein C4K25_3024 [Pseudomonas chlororaphis]|nr:hypothetical protein C4K27_3216 [Pseudomonas chlororaphis subsp. chlororaphis]AZD15953.1 hypothetical protein C4K25_3024 [Pseudomonas chlororaphis]